MSRRETRHCTGCRNLAALMADVVNEACCTCCTGADGERPGNGGVASE